MRPATFLHPPTPPPSPPLPLPRLPPLPPFIFCFLPVLERERGEVDSDDGTDRVIGRGGSGGGRGQLLRPDSACNA